MTQNEALEILKMGHNVFLTGAPGSGKTFLLNQYIDFLKSKDIKVGITASTGIAATHINGMTIHSWSGLGIKDDLTRSDFDGLSRKRNIKSRIEKTGVLVIDEISMLHSFRLDLVDKVCKFFKQNEKPFGGIQVIFCGDFFQLPPISGYRGDNDFAYTSKIWGNMNLKVCYLHEQHRHCDISLVEILKDIRANNIRDRSLEKLQTRYQQDTSAITPTKLYTHNADVDSINNMHLDQINDKKYFYTMSVNKGSGNLVESLKRSCLAPEELVLKKGAFVMFIKNNPEMKYFNGTLGKVAGFDSFDYPIIQLSDGRKIIAKRESWEMEEDGTVRASISQLPLRLAWAITIHKSQGMSLDAAEIDLSKSFVEGMGYVALSRIKTLNGLKLMGLNDMALRVNDEVLELDKLLVKMSNQSAGELASLEEKEKKERFEKFIESVSLYGELKKAKGSNLSTYDITKKLVEQEMSLCEMAEEREMTEETIISHLEKLVERGEEINIEYLKPKGDRFEKINSAFKKIKSKKLTPVRQELGPYFSYNEIRLARLFV